MQILKLLNKKFIIFFFYFLLLLSNEPVDIWNIDKKIMKIIMMQYIKQ